MPLVQRKQSDHQSSSKEETRDVDENEKKEQVVLDSNASFLTKWIHWMWLEEDASYLGVFRIFWGLIMTLEIWVHLANGMEYTVRLYYSSKYGYHAKYWPFHWVEVPPYPLVESFLIILLVSAIAITLGIKYRTSSIVFFFGISYIFLWDAAHYLNHMYLVSVMTLLMIFLPCDRAYSIANRNGKMKRTVPKYEEIILFF